MTLKEQVSEIIVDETQVPVLEQKKAELNDEAERYRTERDRLNAESKRALARKDELEQKLRELQLEAHKHKLERDRYNIEVKNAKSERDKLNRVYRQKLKIVNRLKRKYLPRDGETLGKLKNKLRELEFKQMTSVLSAAEEREITELLSKIQLRIKEKEKILDERPEVKQALEELRIAKEETAKAHRLVNEYMDAAQREHDKMTELYETIDKIKLELEKVEEDYIRLKLHADEEHRKHVERIRQVRNYEKIIADLREKQKKSKKEMEEMHARKQAETIINRLKRGEKLSTEDLMMIQKIAQE